MLRLPARGWLAAHCAPNVQPGGLRPREVIWFPQINRQTGMLSSSPNHPVLEWALENQVLGSRALAPSSAPWTLGRAGISPPRMRSLAGEPRAVDCDSACAAGEPRLPWPGYFGQERGQRVSGPPSSVQVCGVPASDPQGWIEETGKFVLGFASPLKF